MPSAWPNLFSNLAALAFVHPPSTQRNRLAWPLRRRGLASDGVRYADARSSVGRRFQSATKLRLEWYGGVFLLLLLQQRSKHPREMVITLKVSTSLVKVKLGPAHVEATSGGRRCATWVRSWLHDTVKRKLVDFAWNRRLFYLPGACSPFFGSKSFNQPDFFIRGACFDQSSDEPRVKPGKQEGGGSKKNKQSASFLFEISCSQRRNTAKDVRSPLIY